MPDLFVSNVRKRFRRPRWWILVLAAVGLVAAGVAVAALTGFFSKQDNFLNPKAVFEAPPKAPPKPKVKPETFKWPIYGYTPDRSRFLDANLRPPYRQLWTFSGSRGLIEFQPVLANRVLYYVSNNGTAIAVDAKTGRRKWRRNIATLNASSPAWNKGHLFIATLTPGAIVSLDANTGKVRWRRPLPSRAESSPIVIGNTVYFGSEDGTVYAYRASNGRKVWTYHANGAVKAGLAYLKGNLYFGDYAGEVTALRATSGAKVWSTGTSGASFNRSGQFYSTPAVAFGRVYLGNTDSFVYSFVAKTGQLAWRRGTGNYVYAAPAVGSVPGLGPTVFIGSYDGNFYAFDARSGNVKWTHNDGGKISGAPTVVGSIVYYSSLGSHTSAGLDVRTGKRVWWWPHGAFNPVISDGKRIYLTTNSTLVGLIPKAKRKRAAPKPAAPKPKPKAKPKK